MTQLRRACLWLSPCIALLGLWLLPVPGLASAQASRDMGWLGVSIADVGEELAERLATTFGPAAGIGVQVVEVLKGGPAERAPLMRGDVIVKLDGQPVWDVRQLQRLVRAQPINQRVVLTVLRESARVTLPVTIGAMPAEARAQLAAERFGFLVREETENDTRRSPPVSGGRIFVAFVDANSPASRAGLRPQDVILQANDQSVRSLEDFERALRRSDLAVSLLVERRDAQAPIPLTLELPRR